MSTEKKLTGYPSIDKPWMKYYPTANVENVIPNKSMYELLIESNKDRQDNIAINYYGNKITPKLFTEQFLS